CRQCERTLGLDSQRVPECCDGGRILATEQQSRSALMTCFGAARIESDRSLESLEDRVLPERAAVTQIGNAEELATRHPGVGRRGSERERSVGCRHRAGQERIARCDRGGPAPLEKQPVSERHAREGVGESGIDSGRRLVLLDGARDGAPSARQEKMITTEK